MYSNWFKYLIMCFLLVMYINRGLFVAASGFEMSSTKNGTSNEINSLLEFIINLAGGQNDIDEDGDCPETYNSVSSAQPLIDLNSMNINNLTCPKIASRKKFYLYNETIAMLYNHIAIDQPPEQA